MFNDNIIYDIDDNVSNKFNMPGKEVNLPKKKGGTRKIADLTGNYCRHPEHNPPSHMVFPDGVYEHECPACGAVQRFVVSKPIW